MKRFLSIVWCIVLVLILTAAAEAATVRVSWNANTEADLAGYKVYYGSDAARLENVADAKSATDYTLTITPAVGTTYYFAVTAYDISGNESERSDIARAFISDGSPPAKPTGLKAVIQQIQQLLSWIKSRFIRV